MIAVHKQILEKYKITYIVYLNCTYRNDKIKDVS